MRVGEAIARCPRLRLVTADPGAVADAAESLLAPAGGAGRGGGAARARPGAVCRRRPDAPARRAAAAAARRGRRRCRRAAGWAPGRAASSPRRRPCKARPGRPLRGRARTRRPRFLAPLAIDRLAARSGDRPDGWRRSASPPPAARRRCRCRRWPTASAGPGSPPGGWPAARTMRTCCPRTPPPPLREAIEFPEPVGDEFDAARRGGGADRPAAGAARPARPAGALGWSLTARLAAGGSWRRPIALRDATADPRRLRDAVCPRLVELPAAVDELALELTALAAGGGQPAGADLRPPPSCCASGRPRPPARSGPGSARATCGGWSRSRPGRGCPRGATCWCPSTARDARRPGAMVELFHDV